VILPWENVSAFYLLSISLVLFNINHNTSFPHMCIIFLLSFFPYIQAQCVLVLLVCVARSPMTMQQQPLMPPGQLSSNCIKLASKRLSVSFVFRFCVFCVACLCDVRTHCTNWGDVPASIRSDYGLLFLHYSLHWLSILTFVYYFLCDTGITSGKAYCGLVGSPLRHEYAVMGPSTNLSARLMGKAKPGMC